MRFVHGARTSLIIAFASTIGTILLGTFIGLIAGYFGGLIEKVVGRVIDFILTFPFLLFVIASNSFIASSTELFFMLILTGSDFTDGSISDIFLYKSTHNFLFLILIFQ
jgi:peptide/nickel transport system permease protein